MQRSTYKNYKIKAKTKKAQKNNEFRDVSYPKRKEKNNTGILAKSIGHVYYRSIVSRVIWTDNH